MADSEKTPSTERLVCAACQLDEHDTARAYALRGGFQLEPCDCWCHELARKVSRRAANPWTDDTEREWGAARSNAEKILSQLGSFGRIQTAERLAAGCNLPLTSTTEALSSLVNAGVCRISPITSFEGRPLYVLEPGFLPLRIKFMEAISRIPAFAIQGDPFLSDFTRLRFAPSSAFWSHFEKGPPENSLTDEVREPLSFWAVEHRERSPGGPPLAHVVLTLSTDAAVRTCVELARIAGTDVKARPAITEDFATAPASIAIYSPACLDWALTIREYAFGDSHEETYIIRNTPLSRIITEALRIANSSARPGQAAAPRSAVTFRPAWRHEIEADTAKSWRIRNSVIVSDRRRFRVNFSVQVALLILLSYLAGVVHGGLRGFLLAVCSVIAFNVVHVALDTFVWMNDFHNRWHLPSELQLPESSSEGLKSKSAPPVLTDADVARWDSRQPE